MIRRRSPTLLVGAAIVAVLVIVAALAPVLAPYDPVDLAGPSLAAPSADHLFGTNVLGQDIASQIIWGARSSLIVGVGATALAIALAVVVGATSGLVGGMGDMVAMRAVDVVMALPRLPLLVLVAALVGPSRTNLVVLIALVFFAGPARIFRSQTLSVRQRGFVASARGFGGGLVHLVRRHVVPAIAPIIASVSVAIVGRTILFAATLAFLGLADPTEVSWGLMINRALATPGLYFIPAWTWLVLPAGFAIALAVLGFTFLGVGLEPLLNPRLGRDRPSVPGARREPAG